MGIPGANQPTNEFIRCNLYILARLEASDAVAHLGELVSKPHDALMRAVAGRNVADNTVLKAEARFDLRRGELVDTLPALALKIGAHYESKTHEGYAHFFPLTPAKIAALPERDQPEALAALNTRLGAVDTPPEIARAASAYLRIYGAYTTARTDLAEAEATLAGAGKAIAHAREECLVGYARLRGRLMDMYPRQPKTVAGYFPKTQRKAPKGAQAVESGVAATP